jgi:hypothetical protein
MLSVLRLEGFFTSYDHFKPDKGIIDDSSFSQQVYSSGEAEVSENTMDETFVLRVVPLF